MNGENDSRIKVVEMQTFISLSTLVLFQQGLLPSELILFQAGESGNFYLPNDDPDEIALPSQVVIYGPNLKND